MMHQIAGIINIAALVVAPMGFAAPDIKMVKVKGGCYQMGDTFGTAVPMRSRCTKSVLMIST
jgi:hypothetical protein